MSSDFATWNLHIAISVYCSALRRARGSLTLDGSGMVVGQAALAFEVITGRVADVARMRDSFGDAVA